MILLFDGHCNLCNGAVQTVIKYNKAANIRFAALQSGFGQEWLGQHHLPQSDFDTFVLIEDERYYTRSDAALRVSRHLGFWWSCMYAFILVPPQVRNFVYNIIARNRYKWFGRNEQCMLPTEDLKKRFMD